MAYREALEAAGYTVLDFAEFGSYQGDWLARTDKGIVHGYYGSCSGCDAFEAQFGWRYKDWPEDERRAKLAVFGAAYEPYSEAELANFVARLHENIAWDSDAPAMLTQLAAWGVNTDVS